MEQFYLKSTKSAMGTEPIFCDADGNLLFETRLTEFIAPMDCCAGTVHLPDKYRIFGADKTPLTEVTRNKKKMMPEFEARELGTGNLITTVKKRFSLFALPIEMTTETGKCKIEGNVFKRKFVVTDANGMSLFSVKPASMPWGESFVIEYDANLNAGHVIATMVLAIESAYYTGN